MKKSLLSLSALLLLSLLTGCGGGSSSSSSSSGTTVTVVDGYIKDANVTDALGQKATYSSNGQYTFASSPQYPITVTGGRYEDTNASFDINMTTQSGTVISPITTFLDGNTTLLNKLANLGLSGNPAAFSDFGADYVDTNDSDLAKLAQLLYVMQTDSNLSKQFKNSMVTNSPTSLITLFTLAEGETNTTVSVIYAPNYRTLLTSIKNLASAPSEYEKDLNSSKSGLQISNLIAWKGKAYGTVTSPFTGKVWLDRNLGASEVCTALNDTACYGDYYQWGRNADGHQESNSTTTTTLATDMNATNANGKFITNTSSPYDWTTADSNGSLRSVAWSKTDGSSICPVGYRVPTTAELAAETTLASTAVTNNADAFADFLKLPSAGYRSNKVGSLNYQGSDGFVWSSGVTGSYSQYLYFFSGYADTYHDFRADGLSVRCLRD